MNKEEAQKRADRIRAFREELLALEGEGAGFLSQDQKRGIAARHDALLADLAARFDVDTTEALKQMSWGMRIALFLGAVALSAAVFFFFQRIWGSLATAVQILLLIGAPVLGVAAVEYAARKERTLYFASLLAVIAFACFVLDLNLLGSTFNITPTPNALLVWAAFAFVLAYTYGLRLLLVGGIASFLAFLSATVASWAHHDWIDFGERPENLFLSGFVIFALGWTSRNAANPGFPSIYRVAGLLALFLPALLLANVGEISYLRLASEAVETLYQFLGMLLAGLGIWIGIRRRWPEVTNLGSTFFVVFLYARLFHGWWDQMPRYLFFLVMGLLAVGLLFILKRFRRLSQREAA